MNTQSTIEAAITRSVSQNEIVKVEVEDIAVALTEVNTHAEDYDHTAENAGENGERREDVWGTTEAGSEFRLLLIEA